MLLPADLAHRVFQQGFPLSSFQLPHVPSLIPDLAIYVPLQLISGSWRFASLSMGVVQFLGVTMASGLIVRQMVGVRALEGSLVFLLLALPALFWEMASGQFYTHLHLLVQVVSHGGQFILSLFTVVIAVACLRDFNARRLILLFALSALCFLCDPLTLVELHLPLFVAALPLLRRRPSITPILVIMLAGAAAGHFLDVSLFARFLTREGGSDIEEASGKVGVISQHVLLWWHDMTIGRLIAWPLPVALLFLAAWGSTGSRWHGAALSLAKQPEQFSVFAFYRRFALAALSMTSLLAITLLYDRSPNAGAFIDYVDISWYRYLDTLFWWPMIIAAALLAAFLADLGLNRVILPAGLAALVCLVARLPDHWPMLATWRPMITDCLVENRTALGESSGLAAYWNARDVAASLDWAIEIDQILPDGRIMYWGNDPLVYRPRPGKQSYGFVIVKGLDEAAIRQNYGPPDQVLACPGSDVWIYRDTDRIQRRLYAEP